MPGFGGAVKLTGESEYRRALSQITQSLREVSSQMSVVTSAYDKNDSSLATLKAKQQALNSALEKQKAVLANATSAYSSFKAKVDEQGRSHAELVQKYETEKRKLEEIRQVHGEASLVYKNQLRTVEDLSQQVAKSTTNYEDNQKALSKLAVQMNNAQTEVNKTARELNHLSDETEESGRQAKNAGDGFTVFKGIVSNLASSAIMAALNGLKQLSSALIDVGKKAYAEYSEYEQLVGGVETLFGDSAKTIQKYASEAYKTAGISANEYMSQATSFSATLLQGLGGDTVKAAEYANMAIMDMSDNANKMGTSMESIQNAYQGFAKDNYTMLDNLKLGYGGTAGEMARLINDTKVLGEGVEVTAEEVKNVPFDKIIEAIHQTQQQIGITGTTMQEAEHTIEGSTKSVKASFDNLLVAIADDNQDLGKALNIFIDNVMIMIENALPKIKNIVKGIGSAIKQMIQKYMPEVADTILPAVTKIYNAVKKVLTFIAKNFKTIVPIVLSAVAAFTAFNAAMKIASMISAVQAAISKLSSTVGIATKIQYGWNAAMSANPIGAVITAIAALVAALIALGQIETQAEREHKAEMEALQEQHEALLENVNAWEELKQAKQQDYDAGMTELSYYQTLYNELESLTDANGRVKEGYEERASFIISQLSEAFGLEIEMVDGVIQKTDELKDSIDLLMEKKKAEIILNSQADLYEQAINDQSRAIEDLIDKRTTYESKQREWDSLDRQYTQAWLGFASSRSSTETEMYRRQMESLEDSMSREAEALAMAKSDYETADNLVKEYAFNVATYNKNLELAHAEDYAHMSQATWNYVKDLESADDAQRTMLEKQIEDTQAHLQVVKELKETTGDEMYDTQIRQDEELLAALQADLDNYNAAHTSALAGTQIIWQDGLAQQLSELTGAQIDFKEGADGLVQMYINGFVEGKPRSKEEMAKLVTDSINEISKQKTGATAAGEGLIDGVNNGIANQSKQNSVFATIANFGQSLLNTLKNSLAEHSPSKATREMGRFLLEGIGLGMDDEKGKTLRKASGIGESVLSSINSEISQGVSLGNMTINAKANAARTAEAESSSMVASFKEALRQMKIELDGDVAGEFVDRTVTQLIYG